MTTKVQIKKNEFTETLKDCDIFFEDMNKLHVYIKFHEKNVTGGGGGIYFPKNKAIINVCTNVCHRFEI